MDANAIARELVGEITDKVRRHLHPRSGVLVPPNLHGRRVVLGMKIGEQVMDRVDDLLETEVETWPLETEPEVSMELQQDGSAWVVSWFVETAPVEDSEEDDATDATDAADATDAPAAGAADGGTDELEA